jgi:hypothetical protein
MKRIAWLLLVTLGAETLMHAQTSTTSMNLSGTICRSSCVAQVENRNTCDTGCTNKQGDAVLVDDQGNIRIISRQDQSMCESYMGKHVRAQAVPTEKEREDALHILKLAESQSY